MKVGDMVLCISRYVAAALRQRQTRTIGGPKGPHCRELPTIAQQEMASKGNKQRTMQFFHCFMRRSEG